MSNSLRASPTDPSAAPQTAAQLGPPMAASTEAPTQPLTNAPGYPPETAAAPAASRRSGIAPALGLFFLAPLVAEFLLGNLPIKLLPAMIVLAPLYGGGALLIREIARRTDRGWPTILLLGMAYALFEEGFTTQSLFNPDYLGLHLGLLAPAYVAPLGIGGWWTLWMLNVHAVWSIGTPIALVEAAVPDRAHTPWLGRAGLTIPAVVFVLGAVANTAIAYGHDHFIASPPHLAGAALAVLLLIVGAFRIPPIPATPRGKGDGVPAPILTGLSALVAGSAALLIPLHWGWSALAALIAIDLIAFPTIANWSRSSGWGPLHTLALAAGAALAYGWHAFLQHPAVGHLDPSVRVGNTIFLCAAIGLIVVAWRRQSAALASARA